MTKAESQRSVAPGQHQQVHQDHDGRPRHRELVHVAPGRAVRREAAGDHAAQVQQQREHRQGDADPGGPAGGAVLGQRGGARRPRRRRRGHHGPGPDARQRRQRRQHRRHRRPPAAAHGPQRAPPRAACGRACPPAPPGRRGPSRRPPGPPRTRPSPSRRGRCWSEPASRRRSRGVLLRSVGLLGLRVLVWWAGLQPGEHRGDDGVGLRGQPVVLAAGQGPDLQERTSGRRPRDPSRAPRPGVGARRATGSARRSRAPRRPAPRPGPGRAAR